MNSDSSDTDDPSDPTYIITSEESSSSENSENSEENEESEENEVIINKDITHPDQDVLSEHSDFSLPSGGFFNKNDEYEYNNDFNKNTKKRVFLIFNNSNNTIKKKKYDFYNKYNYIEKKYFDNLSEDNKELIKNNEEIIKNNEDKDHNIPLRFKILNLDINIKTKRNIISKLTSLNEMSPCSSEYNKLNNWLYSLNNIPFNKYYELPIKNDDGIDKIASFLNNIKLNMDKTIYGHKIAKEQIIRVLAQLISFPKANGYIIGIQGSAGVGKTKLIKEGICNALNYPNAFISLGGTDDNSFLRGHSYTYEGATYGKICESLMKTGIMNPLFLFDELDKVSNTYRGQEIINTLIHITDPVQNDKYTDRYFEEIDFDISRSMIIFTYNDEELINPILKDRMIVINVPGYTNDEKIILAKDYIIPEVIKQYNLETNDIIFNNNILKHIINNIQSEEGVRNLKRAINNVISWINMMIYIPSDNIKIVLPFEITIDFYNKYCKTSSNIINNEKINNIYL